MIRTSSTGRLLAWLAADRFLLAIIVTLGLWGLFHVYSRLTRPWLQSQMTERQSVMDEDEIPSDFKSETLKLASSSLPNEDWIENSNYKINHDRALIYFDERTLVNDGHTMKVAPFALVIRADPDDKDQTPTTMVCDSALLNFEDTFELTDIKAEELQGGSLRGRVHVTGPKQMAIRGDDFQFSKSMRIWSDRRVAFRFERHVGEAIGVDIRMKGTAGREDDGLLAAEDVESISLRRDVKMHVYLKGEENDLLRIESRGNFDFNFDTSIAEFHRNVLVKRPTGKTTQETLDCDLLRVQFDERQYLKPDNTMGKRLEPIKLSADGRIVRLRSDKENLRATASHLTYDVEQKKVTLIGAVGTVNVYHDNQAMVAKKIELTMGDDEQIKTAEVTGRGWLHEIDSETNAARLAANWEKSLTMVTDPDNGLRLITLVGKALVEQPADKLKLQSQVIRMWMAENDQDSASTAPGQSDSEEVERLKPVRVVASEGVTIESPQLNGKAKQTLTIEFGDSTADNEAADESSSVLSLDSKNRKRTDRLQLDADDIIVRVVRGQKDQSRPSASDVWLTVRSDGGQTGKVLVKHFTDGQLPTAFSGADVHLRNEGKDSQFVTLRGSRELKIPARIESEGRIFEGHHLEFDRKTEKGEAIGAGHIYVPMDRDLEGKKLSKTQPLDLKWSTSMLFDGKSATFYGDASARLKNGTTEMQTINSDKIVVTFDRKFEMTSSTTSSSQQPKVSHIHFDGHVELTSREYENGELKSYQLGSFQDLKLDQTSGDLKGEGPGSIKSWRPGRKGRANLSPVSTVKANTPLQSASGDLEFAWIDFVRHMKGNVKRRLTTFHGEVRVVYGPVTKMLQEIDPDAVDLVRMPKNSGLMRCRRLEVDYDTGDNAFLVLKGNGNVVLEGHDFKADADQVTYDQAKAQFNLKALGTANAARIWRQTQIGGQVESHSGRQFSFNPSRGILTTNDAQNISGLNAGSLARPSR